MLNITRFSYYILPSVFQGMLGFLVLPFATNILNPEDYGLFALAMALAVLGSNIASAPMSYLIVSDFRGDKDSLQPSGKQRVTTSVLIMYMGLVSLVVMGIISQWPYLQQIEPTFQKVNKVAFLLTMVSLVFQGLWALTSTIITVEGKAKIYAAGLIGQSIVGATTLLLCLFAFNLGVISLFVSVVFGQFVLVAASFFAIWPYLVLYFDKKILQRMLSLFPASTMGGLVESCNTFVERYMLVMIGGLAGLGIYSHSLIYRSMLLQIFKAAARALWPDLLQELRSQEISLQNITVSYRLIRMIIGLIAIFVVFLGQEVISLLTHGKFSAAHPFVVTWMVWVMIQASGQHYHGYLMANGRGKFMVNLRSAGGLCAIVVLILLVPRWGVWGVVVAAFFPVVLYRVGSQLKSSKLQKMPFIDADLPWWLLAIVVSFFVKVIFRPAPLPSLFMWLGFSSIAAILAVRYIGFGCITMMLSKLRGPWTREVRDVS